MSEDRNTFVIADPLNALWLVRRFGVRIYMRYHSAALQGMVTALATERNLLDLAGGASTLPAIEVLFVDHASLGVLRNLDKPLLTALRMLKILPFERVAV